MQTEVQFEWNAQIYKSVLQVQRDTGRMKTIEKQNSMQWQKNMKMMIHSEQKGKPPVKSSMYPEHV